MGHWVSHHFTEPDYSPDYKKPSVFDAHHGFVGKRKQREMVATAAEMDSCRLPLARRDYCAHKLIELRTCKRDNAPFFWNCNHQRHAYVECQKDDFYMRMMEYERERRLLLRTKKKVLADIASDKELLHG